MVDIFGGVVPFTTDVMGDEDCCRLVLSANQWEIRNVAAGEEPFEYSASTPDRPFFGPGYGLVKALVAQDEVFFPLVNQLALEVKAKAPRFDIVCGNVSGGMTPGFLLKLYLEHMEGQPVIFIYAREMRKPFGSPEMLVGFGNNPNIRPGMVALDVEELVNRANTTCNAATTMRSSGLECDFAATLLDYQNPQAVAARAAIGLNQISLTRLPTLLDVAEGDGTFAKAAIDDYRRFLADPDQWQADNVEAIAKAIERKAQTSAGS